MIEFAFFLISLIDVETGKTPKKCQTQKAIYRDHVPLISFHCWYVLVGRAMWVVAVFQTTKAPLEDLNYQWNNTGMQGCGKSLQCKYGTSKRTNLSSFAYRVKICAVKFSNT